ncbi:hypothetical protein LP420_04055 [Massilia sp. B-10]|nr:hypothetical protein LP420_04055 [Massilia sp. B-10]
MMLVSDDNRMAQIHLLGGRIIFILCRGRRGRDGLGIMRTMQRAMTLDRPSVAQNEPLEWSTEVILDYLYGAVDVLPAGGSQAPPCCRGSRAARPPCLRRPAPKHRSTDGRTQVGV